MSKRPNILFITTDQQNCDTLNCYGGINVESPNIDRLASEGALLEHAYVTCPLCVPSRGSMMSGRYPHVTGIMLNDDGREIEYPDSICGLSDVLYNAGYNCAYFGKWHLGRDDKPQHGFYAGWETFLRESYEDYLKNTGKFTFPDPLPGHRRGLVPYELAHDTYIADKSIEFISQYESDKPFALWCALRAPHDPYIGPFTDRYKPQDMPLPKSICDDLSGKPFNQRISWSEKYKKAVEGINEPGDFKDCIARYRGLSYFVDVNVGRVLDALEKTGLKDDTIVIFHSDHGDMMGGHNMITKGPYMYEETNRVPFVIRYPGKISGGSKMKGLFSLVDIAPTILEMAGVSHNEKFDGISAADAIIEGREHFRNAVFSEIYEIIDQRCVIMSVRTEKWKYNMYFGDMDELYDMEKDPMELNNIAETDEAVEVVKEMQQRIYDWLRETGGIDFAMLVAGYKKNRPMNFLSKQVGSMGGVSI